jgi:hypothetical protein
MLNRRIPFPLGLLCAGGQLLDFAPMAFIRSVQYDCGFRNCFQFFGKFRNPALLAFEAGRSVKEHITAVSL